LASFLIVLSAVTATAVTATPAAASSRISGLVGQGDIHLRWRHSLTDSIGKGVHCSSKVASG
jgi:hypothetical protein